MKDIQDALAEFGKSLAEIAQPIAEALERMTPEQRLIVEFMAENPKMAEAFQELNQKLAKKKIIDTDKVNELIDKIHPEPIIIDKYPREAIRNWLYVVGGWDKVRIKYNEKTNAYLFTNETGYSIELRCDLRPCDLAKTYTLDELCGEEE